MFSYNLWLSWLSLRRTPILSTLTVAAIGIGIAVCMTIITVYTLMANDPVPSRSDRLYTYQLDNHLTVTEDQELDDPNELASYRDVIALMASDIPADQSVHYQTSAVFKPDNPDIKPFRSRLRLATPGFFRMFDVPFLYGNPWSEDDESEARQVMIIDRDLNDRLFGGRDSIGERVMMGERYFEVVGVTDTFSPIPRYFEIDGGSFSDTEGAYIPFSLTPVLQLRKSGGSTMCLDDPQGDSYQAFLDADCNWLHHWVELPTVGDREAYMALLDNYALEQRQYGRFQGPFRNRLHDVMSWLEYREVMNPAYLMLLGIAFMFLAVCLLNTNGLLFAKFTGRAGDISVRRALGCSRKRMFAQHLVEVGVVGVLGGVLGLVIAAVNLFALREMFPNFDNLAHLNLELVLVAIALSLGSTLLAGLYPAWKMCRVPPATYLKSH